MRVVRCVIVLCISVSSRISPWNAACLTRAWCIAGVYGNGVRRLDCRVGGDPTRRSGSYAAGVYLEYVACAVDGDLLGRRILLNSVSTDK